MTAMRIAENIRQMKASLPAGVTLVAVSKFHPVEALREAYDAGQRVFGESRAQELVAKRKALPEDIEWHFIGPLQSNKVKDIVPFVRLIHSIDSRKLLEEVDKQARKHERVVDVLLEIHVAMEESKHGFTSEECEALLGDEDARNELVNEVYRSLRGDNADDPTLTTVSTFLKSGNSLETTAKELNVHPNTVRYRLKRAAETTGWDATDPREGYVLQTAIALGLMKDAAQS